MYVIKWCEWCCLCSSADLGWRKRGTGPQGQAGAGVHLHQARPGRPHETWQVSLTELPSNRYPSVPIFGQCLFWLTVRRSLLTNRFLDWFGTFLLACQSHSCAQCCCSATGARTQYFSMAGKRREGGHLWGLFIYKIFISALFTPLKCYVPALTSLVITCSPGSLLFWRTESTCTVSRTTPSSCLSSTPGTTPKVRAIRLLRTSCLYKWILYGCIWFLVFLLLPGLCDLCPSMEKQLLVFPGHKCGSLQLVVSY